MIERTDVTPYYSSFASICRTFRMRGLNSDVLRAKGPPQASLGRSEVRAQAQVNAP
jgi:hypothetical protein